MITQNTACVVVEKSSKSKDVFLFHLNFDVISNQLGANYLKREFILEVGKEESFLIFGSMKIWVSL